MLSRTLDASNGERKREKGGNINKKKFLIIILYFYFALRNLRVTLVRSDLT